ncbi:hypothetical protein GUITHDRAFT_155293 [Guillardia theta CCMP2712]|uniref:Uncharacterized protein n=1 Tax=Guillardia theta (strain CCMP2712) TaxID=905079 RepID=L1IJ07_GUITC|nr:hypothetical protein GUITHDRAFT_155293 [Guillardia theta CCMP2712]EKX36226.1 hypothetical protein GUITHDRAFT_155293 [Guillardia theta CCMP2712]|mmetsp:Transcript_26956/g.88141  ORF Transcript_26956/g.88141 Transcript_26956/m.88141 type:complete len:185 (-) Transcript_26956:58-612(-)|eukprot:XP_005823206.1 hypothetical protein GUITHDRAFT_155293 [Guillardia theta CCMP2712]
MDTTDMDEMSELDDGESEFREVWRQRDLEHRKCLEEAFKVIDCTADVNVQAMYDPGKYYYEEEGNEFEECCFFRIFFEEDVFWDHFFDRTVFNKCWVLASNDYFMKILDYHGDIFRVMTPIMPIPMRLYILKELLAWLRKEQKCIGDFAEIFQFICHVLPENMDFKRHVLCHYIYFYYKQNLIP